MNLFTSVFRFREARVVAAIVVFLVFLELFFGFAGISLSKDVQNIRRISETAEKLGEASAPRVLFLGNSILNAGIDPERFKAQVVVRGGDPNLKLSLTYPDSSSAEIWDYLLRRYYLEPGCIPEDVILVTGRNHLLDSPADPVAMGAYYVSNSDLIDYFENDARSYDNAWAFIFGKLSATARSRKRIAPRVFDALLPYYQENWNILNRAKVRAQGLVQTVGGKDGGGDISGGTTRHLENMISILKAEGVRVTVVMAPGIRPYDLAPEAEDVLAEKGIAVVDLSEIPGLGADNFSDPDHVNAEGRTVFTDALADELRGYWKAQ